MSGSDGVSDSLPGVFGYRVWSGSSVESNQTVVTKSYDEASLLEMFPEINRLPKADIKSINASDSFQETPSVLSASYGDGSLAFGSSSVDINYGNGYSIRACVHCRWDAVAHPPVGTSHLNTNVTFELIYNGQPLRKVKDHLERDVHQLAFSETGVQLYSQGEFLTGHIFTSDSSRPVSMSYQDHGSESDGR